MKGAKGVAWGLAIVACAAIPAILLLNAGAGEYEQGWVGNVAGCVAGLTTVSVGLLLALRRPANPIGWILLGSGLMFASSGLATSYGGYALQHPGTLPGGRAAVIWDSATWPLLFAGVVAIAFVFPDGRLPSPRWRPFAVVGVTSVALMVLGSLLGSEKLETPFEAVAPLGILPDAVSGSMQGLGLLGFLATLVAAVVAQVSRYRRSEGELRAQMKWLAYASVLIPLAIAACFADPTSTDVVTFIALVTVLTAFPAAIGIAVLRYRLYEIDRLINATLVYGALTVVLAAAFVGVTVAGGVLIGGGSAIPTAAATLAVALAFRHVRAWLQTRVDRRFNRARYEGLQRVDRFLTDLRLGRAEPEGIGGVLAAATSDPSLGLFFWLPSDEVHADATGRPVPELPATPSGRTPVRRGELQLATVVHDPALLERSSLLDPVILRAGLAIEIARLRVEVRRQLAEVEESRTRIVTATYEERRRLERDLHDGAQQRLVSLGLDLRHVQHDLGEAGGGEAKTTLDSVVAGLAEAIEELRELAGGVRPAALDDGLAAALSELAARAPIQTEVEATTERFDDEIEAAAYFVASEALTNAVKHASGSQVVLRAGRDNGNLVLSVSDDGRGGAVRGGGSGLTGLGDRIAALGGRLDLRSDGSGTALVAEFPCES
jgi:signal transduction histidine kinase